MTRPCAPPVPICPLVPPLMNGVIDKAEFAQYYDKTAADMYK